MSSLQRVVERLVQVRTVECPRCKLEGRTVRATVKKRKGKYCKTAKCRACGHRINTGFAEQYVERVVVREENAFRRLKAMPLPFREIEARTWLKK